MLDVLAAAIA